MSIAEILKENAAVAVHGYVRDTFLSEADRIGYSAERKVAYTKKLSDSINDRVERKRMEKSKLTEDYYSVSDAMTSPDEQRTWKDSMRSLMGARIKQCDQELRYLMREKRTIESRHQQALTMQNAAKVQYWDRTIERTMPTTDVHAMAAGMKASAESMRARNQAASKVSDAVNIHTEVTGEMLEEQDDAEREQEQFETEFEERTQSLDSFLDDLDQNSEVQSALYSMPDVPQPRTYPARRGKPSKAR